MSTHILHVLLWIWRTFFSFVKIYIDYIQEFLLRRLYDISICNLAHSLRVSIKVQRNIKKIVNMKLIKFLWKSRNTCRNYQLKNHLSVVKQALVAYYRDPVIVNKLSKLGHERFNTIISILRRDSFRSKQMFRCIRRSDYKTATIIRWTATEPEVQPQILIYL